MRHMRISRHLSIFTVLSVMLLVLAHPVLADPLSVSVGGVWVFKIVHGVAGLSPEQRVTEVNKRITQVLSKYRAGHAVPINVRTVGGSALITVGDILVVTVTQVDATDTKVAPLELARQWARRLAQGLARALPDATFHVF